MKVIDERALSTNTTFGDIAIGEAFQDADGDICIKTSIGSYMYFNTLGEEWIDKYDLDENETVIPLEITYEVDSKKGR